MVNGLTINLSDFQGLNTKEKLDVLYNNTEELKSMIRGYKFQMKIQYMWLGLLSIFVGASKYLGLI